MAEEKEALRYLRAADQTSSFADSAAQSEWTAQKWVWVLDDKDGFAAANIVKDKGDLYEVRLSSGITKDINKNDTFKMNPPKFDKVEDMAELAYLNEAAVLDNLRKRYYSNLIYVRVCPIRVRACASAKTREIQSPPLSLLHRTFLLLLSGVGCASYHVHGASLMYADERVLPSVQLTNRSHCSVLCFAHVTHTHMRFPPAALQTDVLWAVLRGCEPVQAAAHLHQRGGGDVPGQAPAGDAAPRLRHRRRLLPRYAPGPREPVRSHHRCVWFRVRGVHARELESVRSHPRRNFVACVHALVSHEKRWLQPVRFHQWRCTPLLRVHEL